MKPLTPAEINLIKAAHRARKLMPLGVRTVARTLAEKRQWPPQWENKATLNYHDEQKR